ncbi:TetR/AcrR family transcriptional regulator [Pacificoceanicola onchidii]|uniref:TetR/AcrR family transcriptional regulator n=1 Tax=Pacificoceanicola onchidii TaxID=2562685 RepID=UPI0010A64525|nr:TetR/AcrR family transcriptional regulator [Pacificoceanicola onchidii]
MTETQAEPSKKKRTRLSPQEREHRIINGAIEIVSERGFSFSTRELAAHLGISQSLLYRYFSTKEEIIDKIYDRVYMGRWNPEWDEILVDRSRSMQDRLETYLSDYARVVLQKDWVRIFLLSAFDEPVISQRYIAMLQRRIFEPILAEQLQAMGLEEPKDPNDRAMAMELIWSFHSSFFYLGVRQWVFKVPPSVEVDQYVAARVGSFLAGFSKFLESACAR